MKLATPTSAGVYNTAYVCKDGALIPVSTKGKMIVIGGVQHVLALSRPTEPAELLCAALAGAADTELNVMLAPEPRWARMIFPWASAGKSCESFCMR